MKLLVVYCHPVPTSYNAAIFAVAKETLTDGGHELRVFDLYADNPDILENIRRVLAGQEQTWVAEVGGLVFDTRAIPLRDEHGQVTGLIGVATDITEQKQVEQALRESEEKFAKAFRASPDAITISRLRDGW